MKQSTLQLVSNGPWGSLPFPSVSTKLREVQFQNEKFGTWMTPRAGEPDIILTDFRDMRVKLNSIGLDVTGQICELIQVNSSDLVSREITETPIREVIPDIKIASAERSTVLGAPISGQAIPEALAGKIDDLKLMT